MNLSVMQRFTLLTCQNCDKLILRNAATGFVKRKYPVRPDDYPSDPVPEAQYASGKSLVRPMYVWGYAQHGGLGIQRQLKCKAPSRIPQYLHRPTRLAFAEKHKLTDIACGYGFTILAAYSKKSHKLFGCGINSDSQIGYQAQRADAPLGVLLAPVPIELPILHSDRVAAVAAGRAHTLVLVENSPKGSGGKVFTLGNNSYGQCGRAIREGENYSGSRTIQCIPNLDDTPVKFIACGQDHSLFVSTKGELFACGWSADGQTGQGHYQSVSSPQRLTGDVQGENIVRVASSMDCNLAINDKGDLFGWGNSEYGQLLCESSPQQSVPRHMSIPQVGPVVDAVAGGSFCAVLNARGEVWVWGFGLLGLGPKVTQTSRPEQIPPPLLGHNIMAHPGHRITALGCGPFHLAAVSSHGDLYTWGRNKYGSLGLGSIRDQPFPLRVAIGGHVLKVACGVDHMAVLCRHFA